MNDRPRIKLTISLGDRIFEMLACIVLLAIWVFTLATYDALPEIITTHYNGAGQADGFSERSAYLILPLVATVLYLFMTIVNRYPHQLNYMTDITTENAERQYRIATRMIRGLKLSVAGIFFIIVFQTRQDALGIGKGIGTGIILLVFGLLLLPIIYFFWNIVQAGRDN